MSDAEGSKPPENESANAEQEAAQEGVRTSVTRSAACECLIRIEADGDRLRKAYEEALAMLQRETTLPGFRAGKAPRGLVERRFAKRVKSETLNSLVSEAYDKAVEENGLTVVAQLDSPNIEEMEWEVGKPAEFEFRCEVLPELNLEEKHYKGLTVEVPRVEATDELFEVELKRFAHQMANWEHVQQRGIDWDDFVEAEVSTVATGKQSEAWSGELQCCPKEEQIGPFVVKGLKAAVMDAKVGDALELEAEVQEQKVANADETLKALAGQTVKINVKIRNVFRLNMPELNDELAKKLGLQSADEIHSMVRERLEKRLAAEKQEAVEYAVLDAVLDNVEMEMPASLVEKATQDQQRRVLVRALRMGTSRAEADELIERTEPQTREAAVRRLKGSYVLKKIAEKQRIVVLDTEEQEQVRALAARQGWTERRAERYMEDNDLMSALRAEVREDKTLKFIIENARLKEIDAAEFSRRIREKRQPAPQPEQQQ